jgi:hypothetical protein
MTDATDANEKTDRGQRSSGGSPPKRELEQAPLLLRKSSVILMCGAAVPWITSISTQGNLPWPQWFAAWALTGIAGWLLLDGAKAKAGDKASGISKALVNAHPMGPMGASLLLFLVAAGISFTTGVYSYNDGFFFTPPEDPDLAFSNVYGARAVLEFGTLYLALATFAHIQAYEYGGKFNPIFPLMFLGPAAAGSLQVIGAASMLGDFPLALVGAAGSIGVAAGGIMAMYTMYVTMKVAKEEGDRKRLEARERKRAERASRRS